MEGLIWQKWKWEMKCLYQVQQWRKTTPLLSRPDKRQDGFIESLEITSLGYTPQSLFRWPPRQLWGRLKSVRYMSRFILGLGFSVACSTLYEFYFM